MNSLDGVQQVFNSLSIIGDCNRNVLRALLDIIDSLTMVRDVGLQRVGTSIPPYILDQVHPFLVNRYVLIVTCVIGHHSKVRVMESSRNGIDDLQQRSTTGSATSNNSGPDSLTSDLQGLVMAPLVVDKDSSISDDIIEDESSNWNEVVRYDLSGGLMASIRFLRGSSRARESNLMGFDPKNPAVVCLQIRFENKRSDGRAIRRINLMQKKVTKSGVVPTTRVGLPQEISSLDSSKVSHATICLEFAHASDKDGALLAKFDVKCDRGATPIDIRPPLAETARPNKMSLEEFDSAISKLNGIHQQAKAKFNLSSSDLKMNLKQIPTKILKASNMVSEITRMVLSYLLSPKI